MGKALLAGRDLTEDTEVVVMDRPGLVVGTAAAMSPGEGKP